LAGYYKSKTELQMTILETTQIHTWSSKPKTYTVFNCC